MTDLEITKRCAEKMGYKIDGDVKSHVRAYIGISVVDYWPLDNDAQAMALVKKFNIAWDKEPDSQWHLALRVGNTIYNAHDGNLNRAICECVAAIP